jgi:excisionase family DNA binding protein
MPKPKPQPPQKRAYERTRPNVKVRSEKRLTLSPRESTEITGIGLNRTYELLRSGEMPAIQVANRFYIPEAALLKWLASAGGKVA